MPGRGRRKTAQRAAPDFVAAGLNWIQGRAGSPPSAFDLAVCVNALHPYEQPQQFIAEARRVLRAGGVLAVIGMARPEEKAGRKRT
jgi:ubiquinone/menaquinone biosynthesis C-methylase UbiE